MSIPEVTITVVDGGLGTIPANTSQLHVKMGLCTFGVPGTLYSFASTDALKVALGGGPIVEAGAHAIQVSKGAVLFMPLTPTVAGAASGVTHGGPGTGTVAASFAPVQLITAVCTTAGALGTCAFTFALGSALPGAPAVIPGGGTYLVPGTFCTLTFTGGTGFDAGDTFTIATDGTITQTASGAGGHTGVIASQASSPVDAYSVLVTIGAIGGTAGTFTFSYSLDGGTTTSVVLASSGGGKYVIPGTGVVLTWGGTMTAADTYAFTTTTAGYTTTEVQAGFTALSADSRTWGFAHVVGAPSSSASAASVFSTVDSNMTTFEGLYRFCFALTECPTTESDATVIAAFASLESRRVMVGAGDCALVGTYDGQIRRRNAAWVIAARMASTAEAIDPAWVALGSLPSVTALYRDERVTPALDAAGFATLRTFLGVAGFYVTNGRMHITHGDFQLVQFRRVMDTACIITRAGELPYLSQGVRLKTDGSGTINDADANSFEEDVEDQLAVGLTNRGQCTAATVSMDRTVDLAAEGPDASEPVEISVVPLGYLKHITTRIGFGRTATT